MSLTLGIDVGGTKIAGGAVTPEGEILDFVRVDTPAEDSAQIVDAIITVAQDLTARHQVDALGIGCAGFVDATRSRVQFAPNLAWRDLPLRDLVATATGLETVVENDANAAAWGEFRFGAARDVDDMVCVTLGTGVGGGLVLAGELYRGAFGVGGELGHMILVADGRPCGCGKRGCLEQYASGSALSRAAKDAALAQPEAAATLIDLAGGDSSLIQGPHVTAAARAGDELSEQLVRDVGNWLGQALTSVSALLDPAVYVVGGGVSAAGDLLAQATQHALQAGVLGRGHRPEPTVRLATLGNDAGIVGAADLARR